MGGSEGKWALRERIASKRPGAKNSAVGARLTLGVVGAPGPACYSSPVEAPKPAPGGDCPFCARTSGEHLAANELAVAFPDGFPVNPGHALVVPRRHVASYFDLTEHEQAAVWRLVAQVKEQLDRDRGPDGYNVGINAGAAAGQTVWHAHVHLIPRYPGDVEDPRGGVRWVIRARAPYWKDAGQDTT
jgi:diadenosine tetraphosphate (Ap4A) HIT family hydrolase